MRRLWILVLGTAIGGGFYLLLIDTKSLPELYVLAGVALACGVGFDLAREQGFTEAKIRAWWVAKGWRTLVRIPLDIGIVCGQAIAQLIHPRPSRGVFRAVAFDACEDSPQDAGRRAMAEWMGSVAPNTIVVGVDAERKLLLVHQLREQGDTEQVDLSRLG